MIKSILISAMFIIAFSEQQICFAQKSRSGVMAIKETYVNDLHTVATHVNIEQGFDYPVSAYKNRIEGKVVVRFMVDSLCRISHVTVKKGLGHGLDEIAIDIVRRLKMESYYNGKIQGSCWSIKGYREVGIDFKIDK